MTTKLWTPGKKSNEASSSAAALAPPAPQELPDSSEWKSLWTMHELGKSSIPGLRIDHNRQWTIYNSFGDGGSNISFISKQSSESRYCHCAKRKLSASASRAVRCCGWAQILPSNKYHNFKLHWQHCPRQELSTKPVIRPNWPEEHYQQLDPCECAKRLLSEEMSFCWGSQSIVFAF